MSHEITSPVTLITKVSRTKYHLRQISRSMAEAKYDTSIVKWCAIHWVQYVPSSPGFKLMDLHRPNKQVHFFYMNSVGTSTFMVIWTDILCIYIIIQYNMVCFDTFVFILELPSVQFLQFYASLHRFNCSLT